MTAILGGLTDDELRLTPVPTTAHDYAGRRGSFSIFEEAITAVRRSDIRVMFQYNNSTRDVKPFTSGGGSTSNNSERAVVSIDGNVGEASLTSLNSIRYRTGAMAEGEFTSAFEAGEAGVNQYHGALNGQDGIAFGRENGVFGAWLVRSGAETFIPQADWNVDKCDGSGPSGFDIDPTTLTIYRVQYAWYGIAPIFWWIYGGRDYGWILAHVVDLTNTTDLPHLHNPTLPISMRVKRASGTGSACSIRSASWRGGTVSGDVDDTAGDRWFSKTVLEAAITGAGARNNLYTLRNNATFQGKTNHVICELAVVAFDNAGNKTIAVYGTKNATLQDNGAYTPIDADNSVMDVSIGGTIQSGAQGSAATVIKAGGDRRTDVLGTGILIYPGETFTFEVVTGAAFAGTVSISSRHVERF